jgi:ATP-dependent Clp protease ATP-binding subunit ClpA
MFERFTDQARQVVVLAQEEARALGHGYIGTEHILLGLLSEGEGIAAQALGSLEITLDAAREQVAEIIGVGTGPPPGHIPFTSRTKKVLELSLREAQRLGDSYIGTEHILLGLTREGEGAGAQVLDRLGASADRVQVQVLTTARAAPSVELAPSEEMRRFAIGRMASGRVMVETRTFREVLRRLGEIDGRLAAIERQLTEMRNAPSGAAGKSASGTARKSPGGPRKPAGGPRRRPAGGGEEPGPQPETPATQA